MGLIWNRGCHILLILLVLFFMENIQPKQAKSQEALSEIPRSALTYAIDKIRSQQHKEGYWISFATQSPDFANPDQEVNVWVPAMMIEVLEPVAEEIGLQDTLESARDYLKAQYESTGVVRYYGKGSKILPDSDDTTLLWRIAPRSNNIEEINNVLDILEQYRSAEGLYRTWLSPGGRPGHPAEGDDPNSVVMGAQPHIYLFLTRYAPAKADSLCRAMAKHISNPRLWPFYGRAPWYYLLREADLYQAGCSLERPETILNSYLPGQELYMKQIQLMRHLSLNQAPINLRDDTIQILTQIAKNNFEVIKQTPLLLYHANQFSSVSRFYWSEVLVYALWIRLYVEASRTFDDWPLLNTPFSDVP
jgi:hypothetical protein